MKPASIRWALPLLSSGVAAAQNGASASANVAAPGAAPSAKVVQVPTNGEPATGFLPRFEHDTGRIPIKKAEEGLVRVQIHGTYQFRGQLQSDVPLMQPLDGEGPTSLGQRRRLYHWLRFTPELQIGKNFRLVGQMDVPRGFLGGDRTELVDVSPQAEPEADPMQVKPRWLFLEWLSPIGLFRIGQMGSYFAQGMLANDGDHPSLFGDYRDGNIAERILFATKPLGKDSDLAVFLAGDLVFEDPNARLTDDDFAFQGFLGARYGGDKNNIGLIGVLRRQTNKRTESSSNEPFDEELNVQGFNVNGQFTQPAPDANGYLFGGAEFAALFGETTILRNVEQTASGKREKVRSFGGVAKVGYAHEVKDAARRFADFTFTFNWGYASGDANSEDGTTKRFLMNPNFNVGLVLFDHVLAWKTARAATLAGDPDVLARPAAGSQLLPSQGGIQGATYINPTAVVRPKHWLDLKAGLLIAQSTADFIDPFRFGTGQVQNFDGGDPRKHDLGVELDAGFEVRVPVESSGLQFQFGVQSGVLLPGRAFDNGSGGRMPAQSVTMGRFGLQY